MKSILGKYLDIVISVISAVILIALLLWMKFSILKDNSDLNQELVDTIINILFGVIAFILCIIVVSSVIRRQKKDGSFEKRHKVIICSYCGKKTYASEDFTTCKWCGKPLDLNGEKAVDALSSLAGETTINNKTLDQIDEELGENSKEKDYFNE